MSARLVDQSDEKVKLVKEDGRVIEVPVGVLSEEDQDFLKELKAEAANPFAGGALMESSSSRSTSSELQSTKAASSGSPVVLPPGTGRGLALLSSSDAVKELGAGTRQVSLDVTSPVGPLTADPQLTQATFSEGSVSIGKFDAYSRVSGPFLTDAKDAKVLISIHRVGNASSSETFGRVYLCDPGTSYPKIVLDIDQTLMMLDHHYPTGRSIAAIGVDSPSSRGGDLLLIDGLADGKPNVLSRWHAPEWDRPGFKPKYEFARLIDDRRAIVQVNDNLYVWDLVSGETLFSTDRVQAGAKVEVSANGKYIAVPHNGGTGCRIIETATGNVLGAIAFPTLLTPEVKFSPDGSMLAMSGGNQIVIWSLTDAETIQETLISDPTGKLYGWIDDNYLLAQLGGLYDLDLKLPVWRYSLPSGSQPLLMPGGVAAVEKVSGVTVRYLKIPHRKPDQLLGMMSGGKEAMMLLKPGSEVSMVINATDNIDLTEVEAGLQEAIERAGWKVNLNADVVVHANIERGKKQKLTYRRLGQSMFSKGEELTIRPYTASLKIRTSGGDELWSRRSTNMVPTLLRLENGETAKQAIKRYEKPDPGYFKRLTIPPMILRPEVAQKVGRCYLSNGQWKEIAR